MYLIITHTTNTTFLHMLFIPQPKPSSFFPFIHSFIHSFISSYTMPPSSSSSPALISPERLRSDLYELSETGQPPLVISVLASLVERVIVRNERVGGGGECRRTRFESSSDRVLDISVRCFLERIFRYARVAPPVYVVAYVYMDRLSHFNPQFRISSANVHRLLITAIMVASKFLEDLNYRNSYFAGVGGLSTEEMNSLEIDFLFMMRFKLHVNVSVFESYCMHLEREVSIGGGYQIERTLRFMCAGETCINDPSSKHKQRRRPFNNQQLAARVL